MRLHLHGEEEREEFYGVVVELMPMEKTFPFYFIPMIITQLLKNMEIIIKVGEIFLETMSEHGK